MKMTSSFILFSSSEQHKRQPGKVDELVRMLS